ncbi:hypothetical protein CA3LBN_003436 [Candidozyma haemuli]|uniref:Uncharacterized protein n=2 Tax=Candidozyma TaxID=3303203 RepID=A0ABX8ICI0_9ASCO|nr:hypothetical protein CA3LBN_003436 [[Candida] haemuloni]
MDLPTDAIYVDVTDRFFRSVEGMKPGNVVASQYFDMLEGSRAIEIGNLRLDTGLIKLKQEEIMFDAAAPQDVDNVLGSMNHITMSLMSWFSGSSLPVTLLSNRYVLDFLQSYHRSGGQLDKTSLVNHRLHKDGFTEPDSDESLLVNKVLRAFVAGICKFSGVVREIALNVLYDEEDLTTRNMDLDMLSAVDPSVIIETIEEAKAWVQVKEKSGLLIDYLSLAAALVSICDVVRSTISLYYPGEKLSFPCIENIKELAKKLENENLGLGPELSVSKFVQTDCNNKHIPYDNFLVEQKKAYTDLWKMAAEIETFVTAFSKFDNVRQLQSFLRFSMAPRMTADYSSVARGFYQLFFIRDDKSIVGSEESVGSTAIRLMENLSCAGTSVLDTASWKIPEEDPFKKEQMHRDALSRIGALLDDIENAMYKMLSNYGNNKCRQRQFDNQTIVIWDTLQYTSENLELYLFSKFAIGDRLAPDSMEPALPVTAFAYHTKLNVMLETILSGFELNLYKPFEAAQMYWYASYLAENDHANISVRVKQINNGKLASVSSLAKKIKKAKAGPKKEEFKKLHKALTEAAVPQVKNNMSYIEQFLEPSILAIQMLCIAVSQTLLLYQSLGANMGKPPAIVDDELLYNLRMKPWRSVEVPACPSFTEYQEATEFYTSFGKLGPDMKKQRYIDVIGDLRRNFSGALQLLSDIVEKFDTDSMKSFFKGSEKDARSWYDNIRKTCGAYLEELQSLESKIKTDSVESDTKVKISETYHEYFPIYTMVTKQK